VVPYGTILLQGNQSMIGSKTHNERTLRRLGPVLGLTIQYPTYWMGSQSRRGCVLQAKIGVAGLKGPSPSREKRKRSCRGTRKGRSRKRSGTRARLVTSPEYVAPQVVKGTGPIERIRSPGQSSRRRSKRRDWLQRRFAFVEEHVEVEEIEGMGTRFRPRPLHKRRFVSSVRLLAKVVAEKRVPCHPRGLDAWFRSYLELKHGTWYGVSVGLVASKLGTWPEYFEDDVEIDRYIRRARQHFPPGRSTIVDGRVRRQPPGVPTPGNRQRNGRKPRSKLFGE